MNDVAQRNRSVLRTGLIVVAASFLFGFAMVPVYRIVCEHVLGIKLANGAPDPTNVSGLVEDPSRTITVQLVTNVNSKLPWSFSAEKTSVDVHPGKLTEVYFDATNNSAAGIVGNAVPSVAPGNASAYFNKTECFCFTEQTLAAGETRRMPVKFFVDAQLPKGVRELTLSYTFYANEVATSRLLDTGSPLPPAS